MGVVDLGKPGHDARMSRHAYIFASLVLTSLLVASSTEAARAASHTTRAQYAAELHRIDAPLLTLYDTFYTFEGGHYPVSWATTRTVSAQQGLRREVRRLSALTPPRPVARQHVRILAAIKRLASDLQTPISLAPRGKAAVLNWWLQDYGALPEIRSLDALHKSLSNAGYWP
jgi:hypothetical protein